LIDKLKKNLVLSLILTAVIFFILSAFTDFHSVITSFTKFKWSLLPILLILSFGNYLVRFFKWEYYLHLLKIKIKRSVSFKIFFSGLAMSASPAKMGEILKSILLKESIGEPISKTAPIIFAERFTDFLSLTFLSIVGVLYFRYSAVWVYFVLIFFIALVIIISNKKLAQYFIKKISRLSILKSHVSKIENLYDSAYILLQPKPIFFMLIVSVISWFFECFGFYLILFNFDKSISIIWPTFVYALSSIAGAVSMLPGGLGVTEGSMSIILIKGGISQETAVASTFIVRAVTLWFAVIIGSVFLYFFRKELNNSSNKTRSDNV